MLTYYFRFFCAFLRSLGKKQILPHEQTRLPFLCVPQDGEYWQTMNGAKIILLAEVSENYHNLSTRFFQTAIKHKIWPVTRRFWTVYRKPIKVFKRGEVHTRLAWWNDNCVLWYSKIYQGGNLCAEVVAEVHVVSRKRKYTIWEVQALMGITDPSPVLGPEILEIIAKPPAFLN